jgi:hypothetical protein
MTIGRGQEKTAGARAEGRNNLLNHNISNLVRRPEGSQGIPRSVQTSHLIGNSCRNFRRQTAVVCRLTRFDVVGKAGQDALEEF